jgi:hypothetical protein
MRSHRCSRLSLVMAFAVADVLVAQAPRPTALDATVGVSFGSGGLFSGRVGVEGALTLVPTHRASPVLAVTIGGVNSLPYYQKCVIVENDWTTGSGCEPRFPTVTYIGLLGGLEQVRAAGGVRLLAGPAVFNGRRRTALGGQGQITATRSWTRGATVLTVRGGLFPRERGQTQRILSAGVGVRLQ